ncbi:hypothetical protein D9M72_440920 [compost metagenome]
MSGIGWECRRALDPVDVDTEQPFRSLTPEGVADDGAPVTALRDIAVVAEPFHQRVPDHGDPLRIPTGRGWFLRKAEAGDRGNDKMECVLNLAAMSGRVGQRGDDVQQLKDRARPAMGHDQRKCILMARAYVDEMNIQPVDVGQELRKRVKLSFRFAPIIAGLPVSHEVLERLLLDALGAILDGRAVGPARRRETASQIREGGFGNVGLEGADVVAADRRFRDVGGNADRR